MFCFECQETVKNKGCAFNRFKVWGFVVHGLCCTAARGQGRIIAMPLLVRRFVCDNP